MAEQQEVKQEKNVPNVKLFDKYDSSSVKINDSGLVGYINLDPVLVPKSYGRHYGTQFHKSNMHITERLLTHLFVPGHRGKFHIVSSGHCTGKYENAVKIIEDALDIIENRVKTNPIEVLVRAVENSATREEITAYRLGGMIARKAVITSPQRRVDIALRLLTQGAFKKSHKNRKSAAQGLADELIAASKGDSQGSFAVSEKERMEREAAGAR